MLNHQNEIVIEIFCLLSHSGYRHAINYTGIVVRTTYCLCRGLPRASPDRDKCRHRQRTEPRGDSRGPRSLTNHRGSLRTSRHAV